MIKIDAIRHYISREQIIIEGFLGDQNPFMSFSKGSKGELILSITGNLRTVSMYKPGQFGLDIYLPFSCLPGICEAIQGIGFRTTEQRETRSFDPSGTERGSKRVPNVLLNMGRLKYLFGATKFRDNECWCSEGGNIYVDVETHSKDNHKIWTENPVMEPFELHFGIRGNANKEDPFQRRNFELKGDFKHITLIEPGNASIFLNRLIDINSTCNYSIINLSGDQYKFSLLLKGKEYIIEKKYKY